MDWQAAININKKALLRIIAMLVAMIEPTLPRETRNAILRMLRPAESAARRLIVIAARLYGADTYATHDKNKKALPDFTKFKRSTTNHVPRFQLFDTRKKFDPGNSKKRKHSGKFMPRINVIGVSTPVFAPSAHRRPLNAAPLAMRVKALQSALEDLPKQAKRLAKLQYRRMQQPAGPRRVPPLRPGWPPGYREKPVNEADFILAECHALAIQAFTTENSVRNTTTAHLRH